MPFDLLTPHPLFLLYFNTRDEYYLDRCSGVVEVVALILFYGK